MTVSAWGGLIPVDAPRRRLRVETVMRTASIRLAVGIREAPVFVMWIVRARPVPTLFA